MMSFWPYYWAAAAMVAITLTPPDIIGDPGGARPLCQTSDVIDTKYPQHWTRWALDGSHFTVFLPSEEPFATDNHSFVWRGCWIEVH